MPKYRQKHFIGDTFETLEAAMREWLRKTPHGRVSRFWIKDFSGSYRGFIRYTE